MRLLAIYIKNKEMYKNICFSFTAQFDIKYENKRLFIEKSNRYDGFYGEEIQDISVIVGKNGVGKTTLLNLLGDPFAERCKSLVLKDGNINEQYFLLYEIDQDEYCIEQMGDFIFENIYGMEKKEPKAFADCFFFQYKNNKFIVEKSEKIMQVRDRIFYIPDNRKNYKETDVDWINMHIAEKWIPRVKVSMNELTCWYDAYLDLFKRKIIESDVISFVFPVNEHKLSSDLLFFLSSSTKQENIDAHIGIAYQQELFDDFLSNHFNMLVNMFLRKLKKMLSSEDDDLFWEKTKLFRKKYLDRTVVWNEAEIGTMFDDLNSLFESCKECFSNYERADSQCVIYFEIIGAYKDFFIAVFRAKEYIVPGVDYFKVRVEGAKKNDQIAELFLAYDNLEHLYTINETEWKEMEDRRYDDEIDNLYDNASFEMEKIYLKALPQISAGEEKMISVIGNIIGEVRKMTESYPIRVMKANKTLLFIIDEVEKEMHLEWSRQFIFYLTQYLSELRFELLGNEFSLRDLNLKIQLIMTTHSPFMLSDLHEKSIIELEKDKNSNRVLRHTLKGKVFAQNIQRILLNDFFIQHSFGAFAEKKLQLVIDALRDLDAESTEEEKRNFLNTIEEIGEPIVKSKLLQMYDAKYNKRNQTDKEIYDCIQRVYGDDPQLDIKELEKALRRFKKS